MKRAVAAEPVALSTKAMECTDLNTLLRTGPLVDEDWALEAELRGVQRLLSSLKSRSTIVSEPVAMHAPHPALAAWHGSARQAAGDSRSAAPTSDISATSMQSRPHAAAWTILSLGMTLFACGAVLLAWSLLGRRDDLWPIGVTLTLFGQGGLILGFVMQQGRNSEGRIRNSEFRTQNSELRRPLQAVHSEF